MDKLSAMHHFCRISEMGSFSGVAREARIPVSSLSRGIQALEAELGTELLKRSTRHVALTEIGQIYLEHCRDILSAVDRAESQVGSYQSSPSGILRISSLPMYAEVRLLPLLEELQALYPEITLDLDLSDRVTDLSRDGVDIAFRGGALPDGRVIAQYIDDNTSVLCASPAYLEQYGTPTRAEELAGHKAIVYRAPQRVLYWHRKTGKEWQPIPMEIALISNSGNILKCALLRGKGIGLFPRWTMEQELERGELQLLPMETEVSATQGMRLGIYMLYQRSQYVIPKINVAVDFLKSRLGSGSPVPTV